ALKEAGAVEEIVGFGRTPATLRAAQALGVSERTLARRMQAQGLSFTALLDGVRRDAALQAVAHSTRALADIGLALGFAEPAVFWRAFRRWTGCTPQAWRASPGGVGNSA
ncbi:MAG: helix-turn-helix transcriptional regulator, partial [Burkholderiales bacterium]|nr:helix-turn-helix transcriptional regulator [Burkholderiales bacterium]